MRRIAWLWSLTCVAACLGSTPEDEPASAAVDSLGTRDFFLGAVRTGVLPKGAEISHDGRWLYTANMSEPTVTVVDLAALADWRGDQTGRFFASDAGVRSALTSWLRAFPTPGPGAEEVAVLDRPGVVQTLATPFGYRGAVEGNIEVTFIEGTHYALTTQLERQELGGRGQVTVIDTDGPRVVAEIPSSGKGSKVIAVAPGLDAEGRRVVYVANWFTDDVSVLRIDGPELEAAIAGYTPGRTSPELSIGRVDLETAFPDAAPFAIAPRGIAFTPDGQLALVVGFESKTVFVLDAQHHVQLAELPPLPAHMHPSSFRHVVLTRDGSVAYASLMGSDRIVRIDVVRLRELLAAAADGSDRSLVASRGRGGIVLSSSVWDQIVIPWPGSGPTLSVATFAAEHTRPASLRGQTSSRADPNTIVLDPRPGQRWLYVSCRTTKGFPPSDGQYDWDGKIDVVDTVAGRVAFTLVGGPESTGLTISPDGRTLVSTDYRGNLARFYDVGALTDLLP